MERQTEPRRSHHLGARPSLARNGNLGTCNREWTVPTTYGLGLLAFSPARCPFRPKPCEQFPISVKRQRRHIVKCEKADVVCIVSGCQTATEHRGAKPDTDRQFGRIVRIRSHENRFANGDFKPRFFEQLPGSCFSDVLAVVDISGGNRPQPGLRGTGTAPNHQYPIGLVLNERCYAHPRIPEVDIATRGAHGPFPPAYLPVLQLGRAHRAEDELTGPVLVHGRQRTPAAGYVRCDTGRGIMSVMQRSPVVIATSVVLASLAWALTLVFGSGPLADSAAALLAVDQLVVGTVIGVGIVLARGRWTRRAALLLLGGQALLGVFLTADGWWIGAVLTTAIGIGAVAGPWLGGWLRKLPRSDGPPTRAVIMNLGLIALPSLVAVAGLDGVPATGWLLSGFALAAGWAYSQAFLPALWAVRVALPVLGMVAAAALPWWGALVLGLAVTALTALAWSPEVRQATLSPAAVPVDLVPIPPELTPPEVLETAGFDTRGRRIERENP